MLKNPPQMLEKSIWVANENGKNGHCKESGMNKHKSLCTYSPSPKEMARSRCLLFELGSHNHYQGEGGFINTLAP